MISFEKIEDFNYEGQRLLFEKSERFDYDRFTILFLEEFDDDYLNLAINIKAKSEKEFNEDFKKIKEIMNNKKRKASIFINNNDLLNTIDFKSKGLKISDNSVWLSIFEDYEAENNIISLGILTDKENIRADVYADILSKEDIEIKS